MNTVTRPLPAARQRGFSLIEVLVGLLIAMIGVVIMMEVLISSEQRTRTTTTGNDATSSGAVMMHMLKRDLVQAGYGINVVNLLGCTVTLPAPVNKTIPLAPIVINPATSVVPAADANTDRMLVVYGNGNGQPEGNEIFAVSGTVYNVQAPASFAVGDYVIAHPGNCTAALTLTRVTALAANSVTVGAAQVGARTLYNLGQSPRIVAYMVRDAALQSCDYLAVDCSTYNATNWTAVGAGIVALRAQYGRDTAAGTMDGSVDAWDQTTPSNACEWVRASAVRYALVARSSQYETALNASGQRVCEQVTAAAPTWNGSATSAINLSSATDWQCYRYRTYESVAPSRNVVWMGAQSGC